jgi:predicted kinase
VLIIIGGLPATGKSTLAKALGAELDAVHLRIDTIEQAIVHCGFGTQPLGPVGYDIGYALAADFLRQGVSVIAESVNPLAVTRDAWRAAGAGYPVIEVEVVCSDPAEHGRRAANRTSDVEGLIKPSWQEIRDREYEPWDRSHVVVDTAGRSVAACVARVREVVVTRV